MLLHNCPLLSTNSPRMVRISQETAYCQSCDSPMAEEKQKAKRRTDHLKPYQWKKGAPSPNPAGGPKKRPITDRYLEAIETVLPDEIAKSAGLKKGAAVADLIARNMAMRAIRSPKAVEAAREIRESVEGRAPMGVGRLQDGEMVIHVSYKSPSLRQADADFDDSSS